MSFVKNVLIVAMALVATACTAGQAASAPDLDFDGLLERLSAAGADVEEAGEVEQAFFSTGGRILRLGGQDVQVFEYADAAAREAESSLIQPDGSPNPTTMVAWVDQPNFWAGGRLIVLYVGRDAATIELLTTVFGEPLTEPW